MDKVWKIYSKGSNTSNDAPKYLAESVEYHDTWMGEEYVMVTIVTDKSPNPNDSDPFSLEIGDFIEYRGRRYFIYNVPSALKQARKHTYGEAFKYENVKFSSVGMELSEIRFLDIVLGDNQLHYTSLPTFQTYCETVEDLVDRLQANTDREHNGNDSWYFITPNKQRTLGRCIKWNGSAWVPDTERRAVAETLWNEAFSNGSYLENEKKNVSINVDKVSVWDGLGMIKNHFGLNFVLSPTTLGRVVVIGAMASDTGHDFMYGKGNGLHQIERVADSDQLVVTKLFAYGSDTNLPYHYYAELGRKPYFIVTDKQAVEYIVGHPQYTLYTNIAFNVAKLALNGVDNKVTLYVGNQYCTAWCEAYTPSGETTEYTRFRLIGTMQSDSPDGLLYGAVNINGKVYISSGVNTSKWPNIEQDQDGLPDNMAVNCLMLLGFPKYALNDVVKCEYDGEINVTKFFVRRTPSDTYSSTPSFAVNGNHVLTFSTDRLRPWIKSPNVVDLGVKEGDVHFTEENDDNGLQDVHPSIEGMTEDDVFHNGSSARLDEIIAVDTITDDGYFADGEAETIPNFTITVRDLGFDLRQAYVDAGSSMKVSMKDGYCGGRDFDVKGVTQLANGQWKLTIARCPDNALELYFPYSNSVAGGGTAQANEPYQIMVGDHFVLTDILIYDTNYVYAASVELFKKSVLWIISNDYTRFTYMPKIDEIFMAKNQDTAYSPQYYKLKAGKLMHFEDNDLQINARIFIDQLTIKEGGGQNVPTYDVVLREDKEVGTIQRMQNQISSIQSSIGSVGDNTALAYIKSLWKLDEDNHLYTEYDVYSKRSVSALGFSGSEGGGGGATRLDGLSDVTITNPVTNQVLKYDATLNNNQGGWVNAQDTGGMTINDMWDALATTYPPEVQKIIDLTHIPVLSSDKIPSLDASKITSGTFDANRVPNIENLNNFSTRVYDALAERTANTVLAAPNGSNGVATFRALVGDDLPTASASVKGGVKVGTGLAIAAAVLSLAVVTGVQGQNYTKVDVDEYGRVTSGSTLVASDIPDLSGTYLPLSTGGTIGDGDYRLSVEDNGLEFRYGNTKYAELKLSNGIDGTEFHIGNDTYVDGVLFASNLYLNNNQVATQSYVDTNYVSKAFFNAIFQLQNASGTAITPNASTAAKDRLKILVGAYTDQYLSALGLNSGGGGGGSTTLAGLSDVTITSPSTGQLLKYDALANSGNGGWVNFTPNYATTGQLSSYVPLIGTSAMTGSITWQNGLAYLSVGLHTIINDTYLFSYARSGALSPFFGIKEDGTIICSGVSVNGYDVRTTDDTYISGNTIYVGSNSLTVSGGGSSTLAGLTDVTISSATNNQVLAYKSSNSKWVNKSLTLDEVSDGTNRKLSDYLPMNGGGTITNANDYSLSLSEKAITFLYGNASSGSISLINTIDGAVFSASSNFTINGNTIWHAGNFTPSNYLPLSAGSTKALTGDLYVGGNKLQLDSSSVSMFYLDKTKLLLDDVVSSYYAMELTKSSLELRYRPAAQVAYKTTTITPSSITSPKFVKTGSSDSYVLLGGGGHAAISGLSVSYASSAGSATSASYAATAGDADTIDGLQSSAFLRHYEETALNANAVTDVGWHDVADVIQNGAVSSGQSSLIYISYVDKPYQLQMPASSMYIYKRYWNNGEWGAWGKMSAGYADSAGSAYNATYAECDMQGYTIASQTWVGLNYLSLSGDIWSSGAINKTAKVTAQNGLQYLYGDSMADKSTTIIDDTITLSSTVDILGTTTSHTTIISSSGITIDGNAVATQSWVGLQGYTSNTGTVTSITLKAGTGISLDTNNTAITTSGSRTISISSAYQTDIANGATAYGWGNHADAGYLLAGANVFGSTYGSCLSFKWGAAVQYYQGIDFGCHSTNGAYIEFFSRNGQMTGTKIEYGQITSGAFVVPNESGFLKADGSVDNSTYLTSLSLGDLTNVTISSATSGQVLKYNGTGWVNDAISYPVTSVANYTGAVSAAELASALSLSSYINPTVVEPLADGVLIVYDSGGWVTASASTFLSGYATQTWVGRNYLPLAGASLSSILSLSVGSGVYANAIEITRTAGADEASIGYKSNNSRFVAGVWDGRFNIWHATPLVILTATSTGNVGIGTTSPSYKLHVAGTGHFSGVLSFSYSGASSAGTGNIYLDDDGFNITGSSLVSQVIINKDLSVEGDLFVEGYVYDDQSDIRLKNVHRYDVAPDFYSVANAPTISFYWNEYSSKKDKSLQVGSIAQYWQAILPEAIREDKKGYLCMQYDVIALLSAISVAKRVSEHERRIEALERENALLRMEINELKAV